MPSLADLYEQHAQECTKVAERIDIPAHRVMLLQMALDWVRDAAAMRASTQSTSLSTDDADLR
jgi:hypothetical protein